MSLTRHPASLSPPVENEARVEASQQSKIDVYTPRFAFFQGYDGEVSARGLFGAHDNKQAAPRELSKIERRRLVMRAGHYRLDGEEYPGSIVCDDTPDLRLPSPTCHRRFVAGAWTGHGMACCWRVPWRVL